MRRPILLLLALLVGALGARDVYERVLAPPSPAPIGFIGDSITAQGTPAYAAALPVTHGQLGSDTAAWQPGNPDGFLRAAIAAFHAQGVRIVSVMLGTNDARRGVSPARYHAQLAAIVRALEGAGFRAVVQPPPYMAPGHRGVTAAIARRLLAYWGRTPTYAYFAAHPDQLRDGVHPTVAGMRALGALWARALH